jgi:hypothetical protein
VYARLEAVKADAAAVQADGHSRATLGNSGGLYERDVLVHQAARRLAALDSEYDGLVFGRLDLDSGAVRYVGRLGLRDERFEPLVMDWRAPASAPFYQATPEARMDVVRRRVLRSRGVQVIGVEDDLLAPDAVPFGMRIIGDGALLATLARGTGTVMKDIVATIQHEQDRAVRAPASGATLVNGGPGTGKTAVALHRVAYLLYNDRRRFEGGGVLLVGPSPVFVRYIGQVLPSLGEESVTLRALGALLDGVEAVRRDAPPVAALKGSLRIRNLLARAVREAPPGAPETLRIVYGGEVIQLEKAELETIRRRVHGRRTPPNASRTAAVEELIAALWNRAQSWSEPPRGWDRELFKAEIWDRREFVNFAYDWWPTLTPGTVLGWLRDPARVRRAGGRLFTPAELTLLAASWEHDGFSVADIALLDELRVLVGEPPRKVRTRKQPREDGEYRELSTVADRRGWEPFERPPHYDEYAHIVVDEAQDISPMQWRMLGRRGRYASWTIVGDAAQSSWADPAEAELERDRALGRLARRTFTLSTNYRNPAEIFEFAARLLRRVVPDADLPAAVRSTGRYPEHRVVEPDELTAAVLTEVRTLLDQVDGTVGVITTTARRDEAAEWLTALAGTPGADRVHAVGSLDAKGMEYDGVVVVQPGDILDESSAGARTLYVVLTRATQRLVTVATDRSWLTTVE